MPKPFSSKHLQKENQLMFQVKDLSYDPDEDHEILTLFHIPQMLRDLPSVLVLSVLYDLKFFNFRKNTVQHFK